MQCVLYVLTNGVYQKHRIFNLYDDFKKQVLLNDCPVLLISNLIALFSFIQAIILQEIIYKYKWKKLLKWEIKNKLFYDNCNKNKSINTHTSTYKYVVFIFMHHQVLLKKVILYIKLYNTHFLSGLYVFFLNSLYRKWPLFSSNLVFVAYIIKFRFGLFL